VEAPTLDWGFQGKTVVVTGASSGIFEGQWRVKVAAPFFLLSGVSAYVDGATLVADGGWLAQ
jgi:NAD(P)-dependent dehydrogenase (short-subunit alcohol dehydrogenase family)